MDKTQLLERIGRIAESSKEEWEEMEATVRRYPYAVLLRAMRLAGDKVWGAELIDAGRMAVEALYLENFCTTADLLSRAKELKAKTEPFDIMKEINDYQEVSFKTAPKSVILLHFLEENDFSPSADNEGNATSLDELGKKSIHADDSLVSETLAVVYAKQGKIDLAIEMYEKLAMQNPEKSSTFATRISELRAQKEA